MNSVTTCTSHEVMSILLLLSAMLYREPEDYMYVFKKRTWSWTSNFHTFAAPSFVSELHLLRILVREKRSPCGVWIIISTSTTAADVSNTTPEHGGSFYLHDPSNTRALQIQPYPKTQLPMGGHRPCKSCAYSNIFGTTLVPLGPTIEKGHSPFSMVPRALL